MKSFIIDYQSMHHLMQHFWLLFIGLPQFSADTMLFYRAVQL